MSDTLDSPPDEILQALRRMQLLAGPSAPGIRLTGGVSSDIWRIELPDGPICVKRALEKLKVAADWHAPTERSLYEARWMRHAGAAAPDAVPKLLGHDEASGVLAMEYLPPSEYSVWKEKLHNGDAEGLLASRIALALARIHAATAAKPALAEEFSSDSIFHDIRLEPYLLAAARAHPDVAPQLEALVETTRSTRLVMVHGDVSPKNILCGPRGPVFLDAECAVWGDPAFDLAFCLNHLLLKWLWVPFARPKLLACYILFSAAYLNANNWEPRVALERRAARLLPGLMLARVDGKSPVEYITAEADKDKVRRVARALLIDPPDYLAAVRLAWAEEVGE